LWRWNASIIAVGSSNLSLKRSCRSFRTAFIHGTRSGGGTRPKVKKIVSDALRYQASGSRTESRTRASGKAAEISRQNEAPGQSTIARYRASSSGQSTGWPSMASIHPGT
jgi:hypothetical protein